LDAGSWKSEKFANERIPTFKEALSVMPENIWLNVHIKGGKTLGERVARVIVDENREHQAFLACGSDAALGAKEISPELMICNMERQGNRDEYIQKTIGHKSEFIQLLGNRTNRQFEAEIATLKQHHIRINYCCSDSSEEVRALLNSGIDFILTDKLSEMLEAAESVDIRSMQSHHKNPAATYEQVRDGIVVQTEPGFVKLQVCAENIIRVLVSPGKIPDQKESIMVIHSPAQKVKWSVTEEREEISIMTDRVIAKFNKHNHQVSFFDRSGQIILSGGDHHLEPAEVMGEQVFLIRQNFHLSPAEAIYGLGQFQDGIMNYRGHDLSLVQENTVAVVPFFVSTQNYGLLWDNYSYTRFHDGDDGTFLWSNVADAIDYYVVAGDDLDDVISGYRFLTGKAPMFGKWAYGYWQSKERYHTQDEIISVVKEYRDRKLPIDNIVQDWMYWGDLGWSALDFDPKKFPDPKGMIDTIHGYNMHVMISVWPNFALKTDVFKEMESKGFVIRGEDGKSRGLYDAYNKDARKLYWDWLNKNMFSIGMDAWWMDATEPEIAGASPDEIAENLGNYGYNALGSMARYLNPFSLMSCMGVYENQRKVSEDKRVYILTRSAFAGQQRYGAVTWSGDIHAQWDVF
ncbi:MAG: DUF4968 domain-containing protein, partial [Bacteroidales bacterium]|nr:DUF4968 domain-containing protein [Bacteroidales bacterium]